MQCGVEEARIGEQIVSRRTHRHRRALRAILGFSVPLVEGQHPARQSSRGHPITAIDCRHRPIQQVIDHAPRSTGPTRLPTPSCTRNIPPDPRRRRIVADEPHFSWANRRGLSARVGVSSVAPRGHEALTAHGGVASCDIRKALAYKQFRRMMLVASLCGAPLETAGILRPTGSSSPQSERKARDFAGPYPFLDAVRQPRSDGCGDGAGASGDTMLFRRAMYSARVAGVSYPAACGQGSCSRRKSHWWQTRRPRRRTTPAAGSHRGPVGRRKGLR